mmetsp:Transcript_28221/g.58700  ORF Transcript_28221/g.58700 Transcript_28221/m.58700 type:complete len:704 (-) Transcript_28221:111-2222(-)
MDKLSVILSTGAGLCLLGGTGFVAPRVAPRGSGAVVERSAGAEFLGRGASAQAPDRSTAAATGALAVGAGCLALAAAAGRKGNKERGAARGAALVSCAFDASKEIGACDPLLFWDPIGFCEGGSKEDFDRRRAVELKHGRLCMFATIGMVWPDIFGKFSGYLSPSLGLKFEDVPSGLGAITKVPLEGWAQILVLAGVMETQLFKDKSFGGPAYGTYGEEPGNFGTGYWGRKIEDPAERRQKLTTELNNGRLAMISVTAMLVQNGLTGQSPIEQLASGHISPFNDGQGLFATAGFDPSNELGAVPPLGYWDPFGMMAFGDKARFDRNRELELKHGRICMVATIGMVAPDIFGRFPGDLSPSQGLHFSDIPSGLAAVSKVPAEGWLQIIAVAGLLEAKNLAFPTNYGWPAFLGQINKLSPEDKKRKLTAEINNGRLAMMAFAAMVAQNGVTGQSLVEQFSTGNLNPFIGGYAEAPRSIRTELRAAQSGVTPGGNSLALPWAPTPKGLSNNPVDQRYVGDVGFDPLGFAENTRLLPWYREAELAHGRCCMLAVLGYSIQTSGAKIEPFITRFPTDSADPLKAATQVPIVGWLQILAVITLSELWRYENVISKYDAGVQPGDLGWNPAAPVSSPRPKWFGPTFTSKYTQEEFDLLKLREIKHARLAMFGFGFMLVQNAATGKGPSLIPSIEKPEYAGTVGDFIPKNL